MRATPATHAMSATHAASFSLHSASELSLLSLLGVVGSPKVSKELLVPYGHLLAVSLKFWLLLRGRRDRTIKRCLWGDATA